MKKNIIWAILLTMLASCSQNDEPTNPNTKPTNQQTEFFASTPSTGDSRTYVEDNKYLRWNAGDEITIFNGNSYNSHWQFAGLDGANSGRFTEISESGFITGTPLDLTAHYAIYPYDENITITEAGIVSLTLPAIQPYNHSYTNSFGRGANTMMAVTKNTSDNFLAFRNLCGYLKLKLYGDNITVKNITVKGNNGEKIAGNATVSMVYGSAPTVTMGADATETITIDCGEGVTLSNDSENPTIFWVAIPEITFEGGITIEVIDINEQVFSKQTLKEVPIETNLIQPMATLETVFNSPETEGPANNEIWYTTTDGSANGITIYSEDGFQITSNVYDYEKECWVITTEDEITSIPKQRFSQKYTLTSVMLPTSVKTIGASAFYFCQQLINITFHEGITLIDSDAFRNCNSLASINIPSSVSIISDGAFADCSSLERIIIPNTVDTVGMSAFRDCTSLTSIDVNSRFISSTAFRDCTNVQTITLGENVQAFHNYGAAFYGCNKVTTIFCKPTNPPAICIYANGADCDLPNKSVGYTIYVPRDSYESYTQYSSSVPNYARQQNWYFYEDLIQPYDFD